ncbi:hypothetical protein GCM10010392_13170 [Streptomyces clavifer]|nr:hypothetical protein GCM10010392_13170 [Streptomyces clavifer]
MPSASGTALAPALPAGADGTSEGAPPGGRAQVGRGAKEVCGVTEGWGPADRASPLRSVPQAVPAIRRSAAAATDRLMGLDMRGVSHPGRVRT